jgi:hypothetical protein
MKRKVADLVAVVLGLIFSSFHFVKRVIDFEPPGPWEEVEEIEGMKRKLALWSASEAGFKQSMARRYEALKFIGGGHVAGAVSIATFLTTGKREGWIVVGAKACWLLFGAGVALFALAYWQLFQFEAETDRLIDLSKSQAGDEKELDRECARLCRRNNLFGYFVSIAIPLFAIGATIMFFGILTARPPS